MLKIYSQNETYRKKKKKREKKSYEENWLNLPILFCIFKEITEYNKFNLEKSGLKLKFNCSIIA